MEQENGNNQEEVDEIKKRLKIEIEVEEDDMPPKQSAGEADMVDELSNLGRQFANTLRSGWNSEERSQFESELREGVNQFVQEVDKIVREVRGGGAQRMRAQAETIIEKDAGEIGRRTRTGLVQGLRWLSEELGKLADQFSPAAGDDDIDIKIDDDSVEL